MEVITSRPVCTKAKGLSGVRKRDQEGKKKEIRERVPVLNSREIRRFRIPYQKAICMELDEDNFTFSANYIRKLIYINHQIRESYGPDTLVWLQPTLESTNAHITTLRNGLIDAETAFKEGHGGKTCEALLKLAIHFMEQPPEWWWIADEIFNEAVNFAENFHQDGGRKKAVTHYVYGKFLLTQMNDPTKARDQLKQSREVSLGKSWCAEQELAEVQDTLHMESCALLAYALIEMSKICLVSDPQQAVRYCTIALKRAKECNRAEIIAEAYMNLGLSHLEAGEAVKAYENFERNFEINTQIGNLTGVCEAIMHNALAFSRLGEYDKAKDHLMSLLEYTRANNLSYYEAQAHRFVGEFYMNHGYSYKATFYLIGAFNQFHQQNAIEDRDQTGCLAAISAGQEMMPHYVILLMKAHTYPNNLTELLCWKDLREIPWLSLQNIITIHTTTKHGKTEQKVDLHENDVNIYSVQDIIKEIVDDSTKPKQLIKDSHSQSSFRVLFESEDDML